MAVYHWIWHSFCQPLASLPIWLSSVNTCTRLLGRLFKIQAPKIKVVVLAINESIVQNQLETAVNWLCSGYTRLPSTGYSCKKFVWRTLYLCRSPRSPNSPTNRTYPWAILPVRSKPWFPIMQQLQRCYRPSPASDGASAYRYKTFIVLPELLEQSDLLAVVPERLIII